MFCIEAAERNRMQKWPFANRNACSRIHNDNCDWRQLHATWLAFAFAESNRTIEWCNWTFWSGPLGDGIQRVNRSRGVISDVPTPSRFKSYKPPANPLKNLFWQTFQTLSQLVIDEAHYSIGFFRMSLQTNIKPIHVSATLIYRSGSNSNRKHNKCPVIQLGTKWKCLQRVQDLKILLAGNISSSALQ